MLFVSNSAGYGRGEWSAADETMKKPPWWRISILLILLVVSAAFLARKYFFKPAIPNGLAASGGKKMSVKIDVDSRLQWDRRWNNDELGSSAQTIGAIGCTLCSLSMALESRGIPNDPQSLNRQLTEQQGYTKSGLLIWAAVSRLTEGKYRVQIEDEPTHESIDRELSKGNPVIAKVLFSDAIWHWVLICGKEGSGYLINDSLGSGRSHESMRNYKRGIYAIRYLQWS